MVKKTKRGFTLIELLAVLAIIGVLLTLSAPKYFHSVDVARETALAENLRITREAIDRFYSDRGRYPGSLEELVARRYLRNLPVDPVAGKGAIWALVTATTDAGPVVTDLRSRATGVGRNGLPYGQW